MKNKAVLRILVAGLIVSVLLNAVACSNMINKKPNPAGVLLNNAEQLSGSPDQITASAPDEETTAHDNNVVEDTSGEPAQNIISASPYIVPNNVYNAWKTNDGSSPEIIGFLNSIIENGYMSPTGDPASGSLTLTMTPGQDITAQYGLADYTSEAMKKAGFTTLWVNAGCFVKINDVAYKLCRYMYDELKFACPIDTDGDGKYEILYYFEFGNVGSAGNQLRLLDPQKGNDVFLADDIFAMDLTPEYADNGDIVNVSLSGKSVKDMISSGATWHINEDKDILALRGPSPWMLHANSKPVTDEVRTEIEEMRQILKRDGYTTTTDGRKSGDNITFTEDIINYTPDTFKVDGDYTLNGKGFAIILGSIGSNSYLFFFDKQSGTFYRPNLTGIGDIWMAKPVDINGDGNLDILYYGPVSGSNIYRYNLVVYDLANNQAQVIAHTGSKRLPVTYDKDHVYLGGVDVVEYFKTLVVPTKDYYAS